LPLLNVRGDNYPDTGGKRLGALCGHIYSLVIRSCASSVRLQDKALTCSFGYSFSSHSVLFVHYVFERLFTKRLRDAALLESGTHDFIIIKA